MEAYTLPGGLRVIVGEDEEGWEHVSVSRVDRIPSWNDMCLVKDTFWGPEDTIVQFHPPKSQYVNCHLNCLHLWKPPYEVILPPQKFVGPT